MDIDITKPVVNRTEPTLYKVCWNGLHDWCWFKWMGDGEDMIPVFEPIGDEV